MEVKRLSENVPFIILKIIGQNIGYREKFRTFANRKIIKTANDVYRTS
jgi:hypothetical protein